MSQLISLRQGCRRVALLHSSKDRQLGFYRCYAHAAPFTELPPWPSMEYPSPYDIFNTTKDTVDKKLIRSHFYTLAKVYHPDSTLEMPDITPELKAERFKKIVAAYDILKDEKKRSAYDLTRKGWDYVDEHSKNKNFYGRDFTRSARYTTVNPWATDDREGTAWDDYHQDYKDYQKQQDPKYQKESWETHKKMVVLVAVGSVVVGAIQMKFLMSAASKDMEARDRASREARKTVYMAVSNYGFGVAKSDRIERFLAHRDGSTSYDNYKEMRLAHEAEMAALSAPPEKSKN